MQDDNNKVMSPEELKPAVELMKKALDQLNLIMLGRTNINKMVIIGILSRGHILLEGLPGLGKTALVKAVGDILKLEFKRIQFTPDLMPADILGTHILQDREDGKREMTFQPGPVFTNILLADEINRASPKTQSAMLETMQERSVTLLGTTRPLPFPFFVLASQNPIEMEGTYPLPEAQLDRFVFKLVVKNVDTSVLEEIISTRRHGEPPRPEWVMSEDQLKQLFDVVDRIFLPKPVSRYIANIVSATHPESPVATEAVNSYVSYGVSPRAAIMIAETARGHALFAGRPTVGFEDVKAVAPMVLNHRLLLNYKARFDKVESFSIIESLLSNINETGLDLPENVTLEDTDL